MRRKSKNSNYLNKLVNKLRRTKTEPNKPNNRIDKTNLRAPLVFSDTSRFKKNERVLQRSRQEFIGLFRNSPEALAYTDMDGIVLEANKRFEELFGYELEEMRGKHIEKVLTNCHMQILGNDHIFTDLELIAKKKNAKSINVSVSSASASPSARNTRWLSGNSCAALWMSLNICSSGRSLYIFSLYMEQKLH